MTLISIGSSALRELHLTLTPLCGETVSTLARRLAEALADSNATVVRTIAFAPVTAYASTLTALRQSLEDPGLGITWVEGAAGDGGILAGVQVHAVSGAKVRPLGDGTGERGRIWDDAVATHCVLNGLGPRQVMVDPREQAWETFETLQTGLRLAGMALKDVARTWFFLDGILAWYDDFNRVRNAVFEQHELRANVVPASTGVSGRNPACAALTAAAWAVKPRVEGATVVRTVPSPRQCPAPAYGSAFSRAVEIQSAGFRQMLVSGTASIAPDGRTAHVGDLDGQIALTMQVVGDLLDSRGLTFADVSRATAYFKSGADAPVFARWLAERGLTTLPIVNAVCDICRDDLLFELEVDAIRPHE